MTGQDQTTQPTTNTLDGVPPPSLEQQLLLAAASGDADEVARLIDLEADVDYQDDEGVSPLMKAAEGGHIAVLAALLQSGAPWNAQDKNGYCAGEYAMGSGQQDAVDLLLDFAVQAELVLGALQRRVQTPSAAANLDYLTQKLVYRGEQLLDAEGEAVMMGWERPLMVRHAALICAGAGPAEAAAAAGATAEVDAALQAGNQIRNPQEPPQLQPPPPPPPPQLQLQPQAEVQAEVEVQQQEPHRAEEEDDGGVRGTPEPAAALSSAGEGRGGGAEEQQGQQQGEEGAVREVTAAAEGAAAAVAAGPPAAGGQPSTAPETPGPGEGPGKGAGGNPAAHQQQQQQPTGVAALHVPPGFRRTDSAGRSGDRTGRHVLNVGFGLGIVDAAIQSHHPDWHSIVEAHPDVYDHMVRQGWAAKPGVRILKGRWQDVLPELLAEAPYDGIFFDTYGEYYEEMREFHSHLPQLLARTGVYSFFNGLASDNIFFHMVYCRLISLELAAKGFAVEYEPVAVGSLGDEVWQGVRSKYWHFETYFLPRVTHEAPLEAVAEGDGEGGSGEEEGS